MSLTMHSASAPVLIRILGNMLVWLDRAEAHAQARKFDPSNYLGLRLAPDMLPLSRQVQIASDAAKTCMSRLAGSELTLEPVYCLGLCACGPAVQVDESQLHAVMTPAKFDALVARLESER